MYAYFTRVAQYPARAVNVVTVKKKIKKIRPQQKVTTTGQNKALWIIQTEKGLSWDNK